MKRNIEILFPPLQPRPSEESCIVHQLRDIKRLIMKNHVISEFPNWLCSSQPPYFPSSIDFLPSCCSWVLEKVIHRDTVEDSVFPNPWIEFPPQRQDFTTCEEQLQGLGRNHYKKNTNFQWTKSTNKIENLLVNMHFW